MKTTRQELPPTKDLRANKQLDITLACYQFRSRLNFLPLLFAMVRLVSTLHRYDTAAMIHLQFCKFMH